MIKSVNEHSTLPINWTVLALSNNAADKVREFFGAEVQVILIENLNSEIVIELRNIRPYREFCWSLAAILLEYASRSSNKEDIVAYVDSDCYFFGDVADILFQLKSDDGIVIHKHNYFAEIKELEKTNGIFNVGLVAGVNGPEFKTCMARWATQVIDFCGVDAAKGIYGDQTYLNEWPQLYKTLIILQGLGAGLAPWNVGNKPIRIEENYLYFMRDTVIFYHFHALKIIQFSRGIGVFIPALGYKLHNTTITHVYNRYVSELISIKRKLNSNFLLAGEPKEIISSLFQSRFRQQVRFLPTPGVYPNE